MTTEVDRTTIGRRSFDLFLSSHPGPVVAVTLVTFGYGLAIHRSIGGAVLAAFAVLCGQLCIGWHNDELDATKDQAAGRTDKPIAAGRLSIALVRNAALIIGIATIPASLASGWRAGLIHIAAVASALSYNWWLRKTAFSFLPFAVSFALLPCFVTLGGFGSPFPPWWAPTAAGALGVGAHLLNTLPDREVDIANETRGLPHRIGRTATLIVGASVLFFGAVVLTFGPGHLGAVAITGLIASMALIATSLAFAKNADSRRPFQCTLVLAVIDVALLIVRSR